MSIISPNSDVTKKRISILLVVILSVILIFFISISAYSRNQNDTISDSVEYMDEISNDGDIYIERSDGGAIVFFGLSQLLDKGVPTQSIPAIRSAFIWHNEINNDIEVKDVSYEGDEIEWGENNIVFPMFINSDRNQRITVSVNRSVANEVLLYREDNIIGCSRTPNSSVGITGVISGFDHDLGLGANVTIEIQERLGIAIDNMNSINSSEKQIICVNFANINPTTLASEASFIAADSTVTTHAIVLTVDSINTSNVVQSIALDGQLI